MECLALPSAGGAHACDCLMAFNWLLNTYTPSFSYRWAVPVKIPVQAKPPQRQQQQYQQAPSTSPARSPSSRSSDSDRSYTYSRSRSRSPYSRSRSSSRSLSPVSSYRSPQSARRGGRGKAQASPADWQGRKPQRAGPPEPLTK